jgi:hypothetical protein
MLLPLLFNTRALPRRMRSLPLVVPKAVPRPLPPRAKPRPQRLLEASQFRKRKPGSPGFSFRRK